MVAAARGLVPILVDCSQRGAHQDLQTRYGVRGYPTVLFLDPQGTPIAALGAREPAAVRAQIEQVVLAHPPARPTRRPPAGPGDAPPEARPSAPGARVRVADATLEEGLERARADGKLLAVVFAAPEERPREQQTEQVVDAMRGRGMDQLPQRFHWIRRPLCDDLGLNTEEADAYACRRAPSLVLFGPWAEVERGRPPPALLTFDDLKGIRAALERGIVTAARAGHPPKQPAPAEPR